MFRPLAAVAVLTLMAAPAAAAPCKDPRTGKFAKCPPAKPVKCKNIKGQFVKCGTPGARPIG
ncbi:hypothetical protein [uncultured Sphingomonas sp.]|uniref:hypothetical protein n=1 Tax=uncultured Sphingomonas sp. TaxID=158754 RepID=UPI0025F56696|nr:hypothetical protein [uncultured Sphingomonas sp.]